MEWIEGDLCVYGLTMMMIRPILDTLGTLSGGLAGIAKALNVFGTHLFCILCARVYKSYI